MAHFANECLWQEVSMSVWCLLGTYIPYESFCHLPFLEPAKQALHLAAFAMLLSHRRLFFQEHVAAHANSCSSSRLLISKKSESEIEGFFPAARANCLRTTSFRRGNAQDHQAPHSSWHRCLPQNFVGTCLHASLPEFFRLLADTNTLRTFLPVPFLLFLQPLGLIADTKSEVFGTF